MVKIKCLIDQDNKESVYCLIFKRNIFGMEEADQANGTLLLQIFIDETESNDLLNDLSSSQFSKNISQEIVNEDNSKWNNEWKNSYKKISFVGDFSIVPPWMNENNDIKNIIINPGMGFGTGKHETTKIAAQLLLNELTKKRFKNFLDIGTGSGILCILAEKLGQKKILGIDIDEDAISNARENLILNNCSQIELKLSDISSLERAYELICANIIAETLIANVSNISKIVAPKGVVILSGVYYRYFEEVKSCYLKDFDLVKIEKMGDWYGLKIIKKID